MISGCRLKSLSAEAGQRTACAWFAECWLKRASANSTAQGSYGNSRTFRWRDLDRLRSLSTETVKGSSATRRRPRLVLGMCTSTEPLMETRDRRTESWALSKSTSAQRKAKAGPPHAGRSWLASATEGKAGRPSPPSRLPQFQVGPGLSLLLGPPSRGGSAALHGLRESRSQRKASRGERWSVACTLRTELADRPRLP